MKKMIVLPTWMLMILLTPLLSKDQPFKKQGKTLYEWYVDSTSLNVLFSLIFWSTLFFWAIPILIIV